MSDWPAPPTYFARVHLLAAQSIAIGTVTAIALDTEDSDADGFHTGSSSQLLVPAGKGGTFTVTGAVEFAASSTGTREVWLRKNGATVFAQDRRTPLGTGTTRLMIAGQIELAAGDYVELIVYQDSSTALNVLGSGTGGVNLPAQMAIRGGP